MASQLDPGPIIALGSGTLREALLVRSPLAVVGACAARTRVEAPPTTGFAAGLDVSGAGGVLVTGLTVSGERTGIGVSDTAAPVVVRGVLVEATRGSAVFFSGDVDGRLEDVVLRDTRPWEDGFSGDDLFLDRGARVTADGLVVEDGLGVGIFVTGGPDAAGTTLDGEGVAVLRERPAPRGGGGWGLAAVQGGRIRLAGVLVDDTLEIGALVSGEVDGGTAELSLTDAVVRGTRAVEGWHPVGWGLHAVSGGRLVLRRTLVDRAGSAGVVVGEAPGAPRTRAELEDVVVRATRQPPDADDSEGIGIAVEDGAVLDARRTVVLDSAAIGVAVTGWTAAGPSELLAEDLVVADTRPGAGGWDPFVLPAGTGLLVETGARAEVTRAHLARNASAGVTLPACEPAPRFVSRFSDLVVESTAVADPAAMGWGIEVSCGVEVELERARFSGNQGVAVVVWGMAEGRRSRLTARDLTVEGTTSPPEVGTGGRGLAVEAGAVAEIRRGLVAGSREVGVGVLGLSDEVAAELSASDLAVRGTEPAPCAAFPADDPRACRDEQGRSLAGGDGIVAADGHVTLERMTVTGAARVGLLVARRGRLRASQGVVSGNSVGVNLQGGDDLLGLEDVYLFDNDTDVARRDLPVPRPTEALRFE